MTLRSFKPALISLVSIAAITALFLCFGFRVSTSASAAIGFFCCYCIGKGLERETPQLPLPSTLGLTDGEIVGIFVFGLPFLVLMSYAASHGLFADAHETGGIAGGVALMFGCLFRLMEWVFGAIEAVALLALAYTILACVINLFIAFIAGFIYTLSPA